MFLQDLVLHDALHSETGPPVQLISEFKQTVEKSVSVNVIICLLQKNPAVLAAQVQY